MANGNDLKLRVLFDMIDGATKPLRNIMNGNKGLTKSLKESREELGRLQKAQKGVATFREMRTGLAGTARELGTAQTRVKELAVGLRACVQCGLVDLGHARWEIDWLDGVILRDRAGLTVPVDELVHALVDNSDLTPLRDWLSYANGLSRS